MKVYSADSYLVGANLRERKRSYKISFMENGKIVQ